MIHKKEAYSKRISLVMHMIMQSNWNHLDIFLE